MFRDFLKELRYGVFKKDSLYDRIRFNFILNNNELSNINICPNDLLLLYENNIVTGPVNLDDVYTSLNSFDIFDYILNTLSEPISLEYIEYIYKILMRNTSIERNNSIEKIRKLPVKSNLLNLINSYNILKTPSLRDISDFHYNLINIHPFKNGSCRIARFILIKQLLENNLPLKYIESKDKEQYYKSLSNKELFNNFFETVSDKIEIYRIMDEYGLYFVCNIILSLSLTENKDFKTSVKSISKNTFYYLLNNCFLLSEIPTDELIKDMGLSTKPIIQLNKDKDKLNKIVNNMKKLYYESDYELYYLLTK